MCVEACYKEKWDMSVMILRDWSRGEGGGWQGEG